MNNILSGYEGNDLLSNMIINNQKFGICRLGILELQAFCWGLIYNKLPDQHMLHMLANNAGIYGDNMYEDFFNEYHQAISTCNIQTVWSDNSNFLQAQSIIIDSIAKESFVIDASTVEPFYFDDPWSQYLANKKVLVISPFTQTINEQYSNNRTKIWSNTKILPEFELISYKSIQSIGNSGPHKNWIESLQHMKNDISQINFDIALLGCGAYGNPLVSYIYKTLNKSAIYIGGGLQLLFGIKGKRWESFPNINKHYNNYWTRPSENEKPIHANSVEDACYW